MNTITIQHIVVMPKDISEVNCSFFQGFSTQLFGEYTQIFSALPHFPHDLLEVFIEGEGYISSKMAGSSLDVYQIREDLLDDEHIDFDRMFIVLWSSKDTFDIVEKEASKFEYPTIHISTIKSKSAVHIDDLTADKITDIFIDVISRLKSSNIDSDLSKFLGQLVSSRKNKKSIKKIPFPPLQHNCSRPMLSALYAAGYESEEFDKVIPDGGVSQHIEGMVKLSNFIDKIRSEINLPDFLVKNDAILFCPSMYAALYKSNSRLWNELYRNLNNARRTFLKSSLIRNKGYGNFLHKQKGEVFNPYEDEILGPLLKIRQSELNLFTELVSIITANQFCSSVRLPNSVMLHHDMLKNIASLIKSSNKKSVRKLNSKMRSYSETIHKDIGDELIECVIKNRNKLLALCDFPIEWLSINGTPIMFTHEISRIPSTPGNLFSQLVLSGQRVMLPYSFITEILILRSFDDRDPIRDHLKIAINIFDKSNSYENINIRFVDVTSENDVINSLNEFDGLIVIFDCHGNHGGDKKHGWLNIGEDEVDVWSLANKCRVPPVVVLSACSTHPIDGSHASVANGFFRSGALSVIGTYAPVSAMHAGQFVARLLYRLSEFVPLMIKTRPITWREIISGFLKMSYSTDILRGMRIDLGLITEEQYIEIHNKANFIINSYQTDWISKLISVIVEETSLSADEVKTVISENFQFVETMLFSQLGRPENIIIYQKDA